MSTRVLRPEVQAWSATGGGARSVAVAARACRAPAPGKGEVFVPHLRVPLEIVSHGHLLKAAIGAPLRRWAIVLFLERGPGRVTDDLHLVARLVPWFYDLPRRSVALAQLRRHGLAVLITAEEDLARRLFRDIPSGRQERLQARFYNPEGRRSW